MFVVIFAVQPKKERWSDYLELAKRLKPDLEAMEGFIDNERYRSTRTKDRVLSLSTWRDGKAVIRWRTQSEHHRVQEKGRLEIFDDYHLRVGEVTDDSDPPHGLEISQQRFDETTNSAAKAASITEIMPAAGEQLDIASELLSAPLGLGGSADGLVDREVFESLYQPGKMLLLLIWRDARAAGSWRPDRLFRLGAVRHRGVRVIRDYGMNDRREAPQFFPEVPRPRQAAAE